jgi:HSP20 family protein
MKVRARRVETLVDELETLQKRIAERAFAIFRDRGAQLGAALDDWLSAERQTVWRPAIEVCQRGNQLIIEAAVAGVDPKQLQIEATPETMLIKAEVEHSHPAEKGTVHVCEFEPGHLFRLIQLPVAIDPGAVSAEFNNGLLKILAPVAAAPRSKKVEIRAA